MLTDLIKDCASLYGEQMPPLRLRSYTEHLLRFPENLVLDAFKQHQVDRREHGRGKMRGDFFPTVAQWVDQCEHLRARRREDAERQRENEQWDRALGERVPVTSPKSLFGKTFRERFYAIFGPGGTRPNPETIAKYEKLTGIGSIVKGVEE